MKQHIKKVLPVLVILCVGLSGWYLWQQSGQTALLKGSVEQEIVPHYSSVSGQITELKVQMGQTVQAGDVLAVLDQTNQKYAIAQQEQILVQKQAALDQLLAGADQAVVNQARNGVQAAQVACDNAKLAYESAAEDLKRAKALYEAGAMPQQEYQRLEQAVESAQNVWNAAIVQVDTAQQQVVLVSQNSDKHAVKAAQAAVAQAESQLKQAKEALQDCTIVAGCSGTVISANYTNGAVVTPGSDVVDISDQDQVYVVTYVPVEKLSAVTYGQTVSVLTEDGAVYPAAVAYIDVKAQYTPEEYRTASQKNQEQVKIKLQLEESNELKSGQTVQIEMEPTAEADDQA